MDDTQLQRQVDHLRMIVRMQQAQVRIGLIAGVVGVAIAITALVLTVTKKVPETPGIPDRLVVQELIANRIECGTLSVSSDVGESDPDSIFAVVPPLGMSWGKKGKDLWAIYPKPDGVAMSFYDRDNSARMIIGCAETTTTGGDAISSSPGTITFFTKDGTVSRTLR